MKFIKSDIVKVFVLGLCAALFFVTSVVDLKIDVINPDGINWHTRTQAFIDALARKDYDKTYQVYHPGYTLMWLSGPFLDFFTDDSTRSAMLTDPKGSFLALDFYAKLSLVVFYTILFSIVLILFWKMASLKYAVFFGILFSLEPFVIGMRRLYHLDFLTTILIFVSFLLLVYFNYKSQKWILLLGAGFFYALALLTKSTAIIFLPLVPFIFWLGNSSIIKKLLGLLAFIASTAVFIYVFFPPVWADPIKQVPRYYGKIVYGANTIGIEGRREIGSSGEQANIILDEVIDAKIPNFYLTSLAVRFSVAGAGLIVIALSAYLYFSFKGFFVTIWQSIKNKKLPKIFTYSTEGWLAFWSLGFTITTLVVLSIPLKKNDRYEILVFPFLIAIITYFFQKMKLVPAVLILAVYVAAVSFELKAIHPYYAAYASPLLGGITTKLYVLDDAPFGIGSYAAFDIVKKDREANGETGFYTISGSKTIKAIAVGGKFSRSPSCVTDYVVAFVMEQKDVLSCVQKYVLVDTVKIGGFDYWYVYKRLNQVHESEI